MNLNRTELNDNMMEHICGGKWNDWHELDESTINSFGIKTAYHWSEPDQFWLPDGTPVGEMKVYDYIISKIGKEKFDKLVYKHKHWLDDYD